MTGSQKLYRTTLR